jgi:hypothetical protein
MAKSPTKSWLPKRGSSTGHFVNVKRASNEPRTVVTETSRTVNSGQFRSSVSGRIDLPNGQFITTVRKDVMDRALGRGEFKKK